MEKEEQKEQGQEQQAEQAPSKIELDEETYAALLDKIDELEARTKGTKKESRSELDELAEEGQKPHEGHQSVNFDEMSQAQLVQYVQQNLSKEMLGPVLVAVNELKYTMEIDKLTRPKEVGGEGFTDLMDFKDEIMSLMVENPKMSMKRAYTLAKAENPEKSKMQKATNEGDRDARLRHLPPHPKRSFGERPGPAGSSFKEGEPKTLDDAAAQAFDKVMRERE